METKERVLKDALRGFGRVAVGFSGGVDSTLLLHVAVETLGRGNVLALVADSPGLPRRELAEARALAEAMGVTCEVFKTDELDDPAYVANPPERCYICKKRLFSMMVARARERGFEWVLDGGNVDDASDYRPGRRAVAELGVRSPLAEAGLTKAEVRGMSAAAGLRTASKPAAACLATRVPYGTPVTAELLAQIERAEEAVRAAGFEGCRVRHHGEVARLELPAGELARAAEPEARAALSRGVRAAGYRYVALDLDGYRTGSLNEGLAIGE